MNNLASPIWSFILLVACAFLFCLAGAFHSLGAIPTGLTLLFWLQAVTMAGIVLWDDVTREQRNRD